MGAPKDFNFYLEVALVSIVSIISSNVWMRYINSVIDKMYPGNVSVNLMIAVCITCIVFFLMYIFFSRKFPDPPQTNDDKSKNTK